MIEEMTNTFREAEDHVVKLLGEVLNEMVRERRLTEVTAHQIEERLVRRLRDYRESRTKGDPSKIT